MDAPPESSAAGPQIHPLLRQRMLNRAATFSEGAQPGPSFSRRRSSVLSDLSDTRHSLRSSTDNLLRPSGAKDRDRLTDSEEPSLWHSAPLAFAILPAVAGLLFQNGGSIVTDVLLLGFGSMFLNWCVRAPWDWYFAAQQKQYVEDTEEEDPPRDSIPEEEESSPDPNDQVGSNSQNPTLSQSPVKHESASPSRTRAQEAAGRELARDEILALIACFIGPVLGAYLLHALRSQLTRPAEGLVSNYNLTIFIMAAELRPISHVIRLKQARMVRLQRVARSDVMDQLGKVDAQELVRRLGEVETRLAEPISSNDVETSNISATVRQGLQPQLDALNRAVRRYEKRQAAHSIQVEARFNEMDLRLKDALSLAAAAARNTQQRGIVSVVFIWTLGVFTFCFQTFLSAIRYPVRITISIVVGAKSLFVKTERQPRKRLKGQGNNHSSVPTPRTQSRSGR